MSPRSLPSPASPDERGTHAGRPYWLWRPPARHTGPRPGMVILHGAGSAKENHADFARACAAAGWLALAYDQRGHGRGDDEMTPDALTDVGAMAAMLAARPDVDARRICLRGSSMGAFLAIHAAAEFQIVRGVIAICPADERALLRGLRSGELELRAGGTARAELAAWLSERDVRDAVERMGSKPLILLHARGDERTPWELSRELCERKAEPRKLIVVPGGHHRSVQHDAELQGVALAWIARRLGSAD